MQKQSSPVKNTHYTVGAATSSPLKSTTNQLQDMYDDYRPTADRYYNKAVYESPPIKKGPLRENNADSNLRTSLGAHSSVRGSPKKGSPSVSPLKNPSKRLGSQVEMIPGK